MKSQQFDRWFSGRFHILFVAIFSLTSYVPAQVPVPAGWTSSTSGGLTTLKHTASSDVIMSGLFPNTPPEVIIKALNELTKRQFPEAVFENPKPLPGGELFSESVFPIGGGKTALYLIKASIRADKKTAMASLLTTEPKNATQAGRIDLFERTFAFLTQSASAASPSSPASPAAETPAMGAGNAIWKNVDSVWFKAYFPFGGSVSYEPVVLFKNGDYFAVTGALEDLNVSQSKKSQPKRWGTWTRNGSTYWLVNDVNERNDFKIGSASWFPAFPAGPNVMLAGRYTSVSSSGVGGGFVLAQSNLSFGRGVFSAADSVGAFGNNGSAFSGAKADGGTYTLAGHLLVLKGNAGKSERHFFAFGAEGSPRVLSKGLIFIDDSAYVLDR